MSCNLPPMVYTNPEKEETIELDFGNQTSFQPSVRRKVRNKKNEPSTEPRFRWDALPDLVLEDIFSRLSIRERYYASQVCRNWNRIFYSKRVWETFILHDRTLTRRKFNYYMGDQYVLDHYRMQLCLHKVSRGFRKIIIKPMENFFNLYEFMMILSYYCEKFEQLHLIRTLDFTFGCEFAAEKSQNSGVDDKVFGTGGKLLEALKRLMNDLPGLKHIYLQDLLLEKEEAISLLDDVAYNCCETLKSLRIINCCKDKYAMLHPAVFINLQTLTLSTQHLSEDLLLLLGDIRLENLYLVQTRLTPAVSPIPTKVWRECHKSSPFLRVHHLLEGPQKSPVSLCCILNSEVSKPTNV
ncbi:uncharacterized protein LOC129231004 isoform X2 [Uloborus diversus]|nr:uncharacterized protein LOC129231004 isoform X2 [Uloborus diversus]